MAVRVAPVARLQDEEGVGLSSLLDEHLTRFEMSRLDVCGERGTLTEAQERYPPPATCYKPATVTKSTRSKAAYFLASVAATRSCANALLHQLRAPGGGPLPRRKQDRTYRNQRQ